MSQKATKIIPTLADRFLRSRLQRVEALGLGLRGWNFGPYAVSA
jgi:hypothetical protein